MDVQHGIGMTVLELVKRSDSIASINLGRIKQETAIRSASIE